MRLDGLVDAAFDLHGVGAGGDVLEAFFENGFGQDRRGGGAVAGDIGGLGGDFLDHLGAHVFVGVFQLDFLGDADAVFGDGRRAEGFFEDDIAAARAQGDLDGLGELANAFADGGAGFGIKCDFFRCHFKLSCQFLRSE